MFKIFRHTLNRSRGQVLGWGIILALFTAYMVSFYDSFLEMQATFETMLENYPPELVAFVGGADNLFTAGGYLEMYIFSMMPLILGVYAVLAGSGLIAADEESGRLDLILGHPVSRTSLFTGRLLAFGVAMFLIMALMWLGSIVTMGGTSLGFSAGSLALPYLSLFGALAFFGTLALLFSLLLPSRRLAATAAGLVLVVSFLMNMMAELSEQMSLVSEFSPLHYYQGGAAVDGMRWDWLAGLLGTSIIFALLAWWRFQRREIRVAGEGGWRLPRLRFGKSRTEAGDPAATVA